MIVVVDPQPHLRDAIVSGITPNGNLVHVTHSSGIEVACNHRWHEVEMVFLGPGLLTAEALAVADRVHAAAPEVSVILVTKTLTPDVLQAALRAGVDDALAASFTLQELQDAAERGRSLTRTLRSRPDRASEPSAGHHKTVTVFSWKGGCGKSFLSANLAILLAEQTGKEVALVDLDLQSGDLSIMMRLSPRWTIHDAAERADDLDPEELRGYLAGHASGVKLLAAPLEPQLADMVSGPAVQTILNMLGESFPYVIIDGPAALNDQVLVSLDLSDECILMTSMDVPSIKNVKISLSTLEALGVGRSRIRLVLNRADSKVGLELREIEKTLGTKIDVSLPSSRDVPLSINQGTPLAIQNRKSPVVSAISRLARLVAGDELVAAPHRSFWKRER